MHLQYMQWCCCSVMLHHGWHSSTLASWARADVQGFAMMAGRRSLSRCNMQQSDTTGEHHKQKQPHHAVISHKNTKCTRGGVTMSPNGRLEPSLLPPPAATSMTGFAAGTSCKAIALGQLCNAAAISILEIVFEQHLSPCNHRRPRTLSLEKANNNMLITSLLLGASFSMIGAVYVPHGWDAYSPHALAFESAVEALGLCSCLFFLVALLANVFARHDSCRCEHNKLQGVGEGKPISIILADTLVMVGLWLFGMALVLTGFQTIRVVQSSRKRHRGPHHHRRDVTDDECYAAPYGGKWCHDVRGTYDG